MSDERAESENERNGRNESTAQENLFFGDSVPRPLGFIALRPIPVNELDAGAPLCPEPQPGLGAGVGAQVASQQSPAFRSGRSQCTCNSSLAQVGTKKRA